MSDKKGKPAKPKVESESSEGGGMGDSPMKDPLMMMGLHEHCKHPHGDIMEHLPAPVKRRVNALKKLLLDATKVEADFYKEVHKLECEYAEKLAVFYKQRSAVVTGQREPTDEEVYVDPEVEELSSELKEKAAINGPAGDAVKTAEEQQLVGIPEFWLTAFKNYEMVGEMIQEHDEPILRHLTDVEVQMCKEPPGFNLLFHFSPNEYFNNPTLTKEYKLSCDPDQSDPFIYDGPEIVGCKGCKIDWKPGKNVTVKLIKKKQKHKTKGNTRFVTKEVKADSFFNFFDPPEVPGNEEDVDEETRDLLNADFEIGQLIRDRLVPRAVLYFTGEGEDDMDYDEDEEEDEEFGDEDEEEDEEGGHEQV
jgi:nucleosome assembly protein 1-like 1